MEKNKYESQHNWQKENGYIPKTYKLNKKLVNDFREACDKAEISQASKLSELMQMFIDDTKEN